MNITLKSVLFSAAVFLTSHHCIGATKSTKTVHQEDWQSYFNQYDVQGTIAILDTRRSNGDLQVFNLKRAKQRFSPASTFKIPHTLFALDAGVVKDEFEVFKWDGIKRSYKPHNGDHDLRSAMRNSVVWIFDLFAKELGEEKAQQYLKLIKYGNQTPKTKRGSYWIHGELEISAIEQIDFLKKLFHNQLPFSVSHQRLVKDIMVVKAEKNWILRAKTGWQGKHGWWVGWVELPQGPVFFALNIDTPNRGKDLFKRQAITKEILRSINALP